MEPLQNTPSVNFDLPNSPQNTPKLTDLFIKYLGNGCSCIRLHTHHTYSDEGGSDSPPGDLEAWVEMRDRLIKDPQNYFRYTWDDQQMFMNGIGKPGHDLGDLFSLACAMAPIFAIVLLRHGVDCNRAHSETGHSPLWVAFNTRNYQPTLQRELIEAGAHLVDADFEQDVDLLDKTARRLMFFADHHQLDTVLGRLDTYHVTVMLEHLIAQMEDSRMARLELLPEAFDYTPDQALMLLERLAYWFYKDSTRVQRLVSHLSHSGQRRVAEARPTVYYHYTSDMQEEILNDLYLEHEDTLIEAILPYTGWYLNHPECAARVFAHLTPEEIIEVLNECPQLWQHLNEEQRQSLVDTVHGLTRPQDILLAFGRNPLAWEAIFENMDPEQAEEALSAEQSPFRRLKEIDEAAFESFTEFLLSAHTPENREKIRAFYALGPEMWKLWIDHSYHHFGPHVYDQGIHGAPPEFGFLHGMEAAAAWLCSLIDTKQDSRQRLQTYNTAHAIIMAHEDPGEQLDRLRGPKTESWHKLEEAEYQDYLAHQKEVDLELDHSLLRVDHETHQICFLPRPNILADLEGIFEKARLALAAAEFPEDKKRVIAWKFQQLERLNAHKVGNSRVNILTLMTDLVENGFEPALLENLREDAYLCTLDRMIEKIDLGIEKHRRVVGAE